MLKIFRSIRKNLLSENKFSKYLIYAIGEIILVVIGILIALAINNRNQSNITKQKEQAYLLGLKDEFTTSKIKLRELLNVNERNHNGAKKILKFTSHKNILPSEKDFSFLLFNTFSSDISFNPNNSVINEMINSGSLKDISNNKLRKYLTNWKATLDDIKRQEDELSTQREKVLDMFRKENTSLKTIFNHVGITKELDILNNKKSYSNLNLLASKEFENNVLMFVLTAKATEESHYIPLMEDINTILKLLETEIKN